MFSLPLNRLDELFETAAASGDLYIPVDNTSGKADFRKWEKGIKMSGALKTVRSAKDFFFPKTENLVNFRMNGKKIEVDDPRKELENFVVFGVRACDAASFSIVDDVYINMEPVDTYYKNRREHGTVITLACTEPAQTCFCKLYGIDAADPAGDVSAWIVDSTVFFQPNNGKGQHFIETVRPLLTENDAAPVEKQKKAIQQKISGRPFVRLDLSKFTGKNMNQLFNSGVWEKLSSTCLGCGTCTYVCPTCMCFDIRDFDTGHGIKRFRCWDSCMYSDFTKMAAANPRLTQKERFNSGLCISLSIIRWITTV